jgi:DNA-binding CsgD family transcriptional regulator
MRPPTDSGGDPGAFAGRSQELATLRARAAAARDGRAQVVWVTGPAGIGKTRLLWRFLHGQREFRVCDAAADPAEQELVYGVLDQLLRRLSGEPWTSGGRSLGRLDPANPPETVVAGLLDLVAERWAARPLAVLVDDAEWADPASLRVLELLLTGAKHAPLLAAFATRTPGSPRVAKLAAGLRAHGVGCLTLELAGIGVREVGMLTAGRITPVTADRLVSHTGGNPSQLRDLLADVPLERLTDPSLAVPVPRSLAENIRSTMAALPDPARRILEAMAVLDTRVALTVLGRIAEVSDPTEALATALPTGLLRTSRPDGTAEEQVTLAAGELARTAIYHTLSPTRLVTLHAGAASVAGAEDAWLHRVAAATAPDADLAAQLQAAAETAAERGMYGVSARYLSWAAAVTPNAAQRDRLALTGYAHALLGPERSPATTLRDSVEHYAVGPLRSLVLGVIALAGEADPQRAASSFREAVAGGRAAGWVAGAATLALDPRAPEAGHPAIARRLADLMAVYRAEGLSQRDGPAAGLAELGDLPTDPERVGLGRIDSLIYRAALRLASGEWADAERDLTVAVRRVEAGVYPAAGRLPQPYLSSTYYLTGRLDDAAALIERTLRRGAGRGDALSHAVAAQVPAARGDFATAAARIDEARRLLASSHVASSVLERERTRLIAAAAAGVAYDRGAPDESARLLAEVGVGATGAVELPGVASWWWAQAAAFPAEAKLTTRESEVAWLAKDGYTNARIAERLSVSPRTVEYHLRGAFTKLRITSRRELITLKQPRDR